jgi:hypothetical protein
MARQTPSTLSRVSCGPPPSRRQRLWGFTFLIAALSALLCLFQLLHPVGVGHAAPAKAAAGARRSAAPRATSAGAQAPAAMTICEAIKLLPAEQVADSRIKEAALIEADKNEDVDCLVHLVLLHAADRNCGGAVKIAELALRRSKSSPMAHLAMTVARQCTVSMEVAGSLRGRPVLCPELKGAEFSSLVRGGLLNDHPQAHRFAAAATAQLARFCIDTSGVLLSLAQVLGAESSGALKCALDGHQLALRREEGKIPMGLTGRQILCDGNAAFETNHIPDPDVLHARLGMVLDEVLKRDPLCLKSLNDDCVKAARNLLFVAGKLAHKPEGMGILLQDLGKLGRHGGLKPQVVQSVALRAFDQGPFKTPRARRSSVEIELLDELAEYFSEDRDSLGAALLRLELKMVRVLGANSTPCQKAGMLSKAIADFAPASRTASNEVWGGVVQMAVLQCLEGAKQCPVATETRQYCDQVLALGYPSPPRLDLEQGSTLSRTAPGKRSSLAVKHQP